MLFISATPLHANVSCYEINSILQKKRRRSPCSLKATLRSPYPLVRIRNSLPAVLVRGSEKDSFVNNMGTNVYGPNIQHPTQTVFTSSIGRCIDLVTTMRTQDGVLLLSSLPDAQLFNRLDNYVFPADDIEISSVNVPRAVEVMGISPNHVEAPPGFSVVPATHGVTIIPTELGRDDVLFTDPEFAKWVSTLGELAGEESRWEDVRIQHGIPKLGKDITSEHTPLEASLWHCVSFDKGCYIGQETIARLNTYDGVKRRLCLLEFQKLVSEGDKVTRSGQKGRSSEAITSISVQDDACRALGYVRCASNNDKDIEEVFAGDVQGAVLDSPFLSSGFESRSSLTV